MPPAPVPEPECHMDGDSQEENPCCPAMQPIEPLITAASQETNDIVLARKKHNQRELSGCDVADLIGYALPLPLVCSVLAIEAQNDDGDQLGEDHGYTSGRW